MCGASPPSRGKALLAAVIPDFERRITNYRVLLSAPDPELVDALRDHVREVLPAMVRACAGKDFLLLARHAHGFKGMGGSVGLPEISLWGAELEEAAHKGRGDDVDRLLGALQAWLTSPEAAP